MWRWEGKLSHVYVLTYFGVIVIVSLNFAPHGTTCPPPIPNKIRVIINFSNQHIYIPDIQTAVSCPKQIRSRIRPFWNLRYQIRGQNVFILHFFQEWKKYVVLDSLFLDLYLSYLKRCGYGSRGKKTGMFFSLHGENNIAHI